LEEDRDGLARVRKPKYTERVEIEPVVGSVLTQLVQLTMSTAELLIIL